MATSEQTRGGTVQVAVQTDPDVRPEEHPTLNTKGVCNAEKRERILALRSLQAGTPALQVESPVLLNIRTARNAMVGACVISFVMLAGAGSPARAGGMPVAGSDVLPVVVIGEAGSLLGDDLVILRGWIEVIHGAPRTEDGIEVVDLEIANLDLVGASRFGLVSVTERANAAESYRSGGQLRSTTPGQSFPAAGTLSLFLDLDVPLSPSGPLLLHNEISLDVKPASNGTEMLLDAWPPSDVTFELPDEDECLPLVDEANVESELGLCIRSLSITVAPLSASFSVGREASQFHPADILGILPAVATPDVGQAPYLRIACASLGLSDDGCDDSFGQDNVDALSFGSPVSKDDPTVDFSVVAGALGSDNTAVAVQSLCPPAKPGLSPEPESDVFRSVLDGTNRLLFDGNGPVGACQAAFPLGLLEAVSMRDELDAFVAWDPSFVDRNADGVPESPVYFSLDGESPSLAALGFTAGDVLRTAEADTPSLYASHEQLGLQASDDIDGLCLIERGDGTYSASDTLLFSLAPGSPTLAAMSASAGDLIRAGNPAAVALRAAMFGLLRTDDIDAASCAGLAGSLGGSGDVNCDATTNSVDAALILQRVAELVSSLPCDAEADVNEVGGVDSVDAALVLQFDAGLLLSLPV